MWPFRRGLSKRNRARLVATADAWDVTDDILGMDRVGLFFGMTDRTRMLLSSLLIFEERDAADRLVQRMVRPHMEHQIAKAKAQEEAKA